MGADFVLKTDKTKPHEEIVKSIVDLFGEEPTVSFDCTGFEQCGRIALDVYHQIKFNN